MGHQRSIRPGATRGTVFRVVARARLQDAKVLLTQKRLNAAVYLAGYAIECLLKAVIAEKENSGRLPERYEIHRLDELLTAAGLHQSVRLEPRVWAVFARICEAWGPDLRYSAKEPKAADAGQLYEEVEELYEWLAEK